MATRAPGEREADEGPSGADRGLLTEVDANALRLASPRGASRSERLGALLRYLAFGERAEPLPSHRGPVEAPRKCSTGICLSGGGIRSAAFNLGALQALQRHEELQHADYLAAVSGGSYIAAAYSMVGKVWREESNPHDDSSPHLLDAMPAFARGSPEEQYLRNRSSYMAPDGSGKLYLAFRMLLGLVFNLIFISLPVAALTVLAGLVLYGPTLDGLRGGCTTNCGLHLPPVWWIVPLAVLGLGVFAGARRVFRRPPSDRSRRFAEVWCTRLIVLAGLSALVLVALPALVDWVSGREGAALGVATPKASGTGGVGLAGLIAGVLAVLREALASPKKAIEEIGGVRAWFAKVGSRARRLIAFAAGAVAGPLVLLSVAVLSLSLTLDRYDAPDGQRWLLVGAAAALALFALLYALTDLTSWSLHPFYKRRLCTAFALKRVAAGEVDARREQAAIAQEAAEGVAVERDFDRLVRLSETALDKWPSLIVCAAANVSDPGATPPGRHVTSFTFSANAVGGPLVGALDTVTYENAFDGNREHDFSLPAAVAMSGAAVSPSMGKMSRRAFTFLLTLANIRLGVWVPNPRWVAGLGTTQTTLFGRPRPWYLLLELLGRNRVDAKYLYVTDGGHYENLGLVELLRRGCTRIFCFDASGGKDFAELGDAVALARSELGVEVNIDPTPLVPAGDPPTAPRDTVVGSFTYANGERGVLVYAHNVMSPSAPWDVRAHQLSDPRFPHDSTVDQLYTDQKFESYRALGERAGEGAVRLMRGVSPCRPGDEDQVPAVTAASEDADQIRPEAVNEMLERGEVQLVDVRDRGAAEAVWIKGALAIDLAELHARADELSRERPIVFHCDDGARSLAVARAFRSAGWDAFQLRGGLCGWAEAGLPLQRGGD